jgi:enoyl-CoA hydratase
MSDSDVVLTSIEGAVGVLTINRPDKFNCISRAVIAGFDAGLSGFENNADVRAVVLCGAGKYFCTGADLDEVGAIRKDPVKMGAFTERFHEVLRRFEQSPLPVIAAVQGLCLAGGLETVMACDVVFAGESARIGDQHARYGLIPGGGNTQRIPRVVGRRRALDLMFTGRWLDAKEALDWGLVNYVVPDAEVKDRAIEYGAKLATLSANALTVMKRLVDEGLDMSLSDSLLLEAREAAAGLAHPDVDEGLAAFLDKREPKYGPRDVG